MCDYHTWANLRIFERLKELPVNLYTKELESNIFPSIQKVMVHIYLADTFWLNLMKGKDRNFAEEVNNRLRVQAESCTVDEMEIWFKELCEKYQLFIEKTDLQKAFTYVSPYAGPLDTTPMETLFHISTHGNYHRGNVAAMLRQEGHASVMQDYGLYLFVQRKGFKSPV